MQPGMARFARSSLAAVLVAAGLFGLAACTEVGYRKAGVTDEEYARDSEDCAVLARQQAFRDYNVFQTQWRSTVVRRHGHDYRTYQNLGPPSYGNLEFRYRRLCMLSKGYELAPLDKDGEDDSHGGDAGDDGNQGGPQDGEGG